MGYERARAARVATLVAAGVCLTTAAGASAARSTPTSCHMIVDPVGDTYAGTSAVREQTLTDPNLDLRSGDVGTVRSDLVVAIGVEASNTTGVRSPTGKMYEAYFSVNTRRDYVVVASFFPDGASFNLYGPVTNETPAAAPQTASYPFLGSVTGAFDSNRGLVRMRIPLSMLRLSKGMRIRLTTLYSERAVGVAGDDGSILPSQLSNGTGSPADDARGDKSFLVGSTSCVT